jgi:hypothetical protein
MLLHVIKAARPVDLACYLCLLERAIENVQQAPVVVHLDCEDGGLG